MLAFRYNIIILIFSRFAAFTSPQCFYSGGSPFQAGTACNISAASNVASACCLLVNPDHGSPDICLSSGLCYSQDGSSNGVVFSKGCTDRTWKSDACPQACNNGPNSTLELQSCDSGEWCCREMNSPSCCANEFSLDIGSLLIRNTQGITQVVAPTISTLTRTQSNATMLVTVTSTPSKTTSSISSVDNSSSWTKIPGGSSSTATPLSGNPDKSIIIGVAIGVPLLVALSAIVVLWCRVQHYSTLNANRSVPAQNRGKIGGIAPIVELHSDTPLYELRGDEVDNHH